MHTKNNNNKMWKTRNARSHSDHATLNIRDHTRPVCVCVCVYGREREGGRDVNEEAMPNRRTHNT